MRCGVGVFKALSDGERYDLIFDLRPGLLRVQCKWAVLRENVVSIRCYSCRRTKDGQVQMPYTSSEIDAYAAYCPDESRSYLVPLSEGLRNRRSIDLRRTPTRNNQRAGIHWAKQFEMAATIERLRGAIAQLGERLAGSQKVTGSSPVGSTSSGQFAWVWQSEQVGDPDQGVLQIVQPTFAKH